jgi:hypothetical protein
MTLEEYYSAVKALKLTPSGVPHVFLGPDGHMYSVPDGGPQTPDQRVETIEQIKQRMWA